MNRSVSGLPHKVGPSFLHEVNTLKVLTKFWFEGPFSRADVYRETGLSKPTVSKVVGKLVEDGFLLPVKDVRGPSGIGKPAKMYHFNEEARYFLVCDIQETFVKGALSNFHPVFSHEFNLSMDAHMDPEVVLGKIVREFESILSERRELADRIAGIGVSVPGIVDSNAGILTYSPGLPRWGNTQIKEYFEERLHLPVFVDNENRMTAAAEFWFGTAQGVENFISISMGEGTGIGSAIFLNGALWRGANNLAGEIGHMRFHPDLSRKELSNKINSRLALWAFSDQAKAVARQKPDSQFAQHCEARGFAIDAVFELANEGDEDACRVVDEYAEWLGLVIGNMLLNFDVPLIVIGGLLCKGGDRLLKAVRETIQALFFSQLLEKTKIRCSKVEENSELIGAMSMVVQHIFTLDVDDTALP